MKLAMFLVVVVVCLAVAGACQDTKFNCQYSSCANKNYIGCDKTCCKCTIDNGECGPLRMNCLYKSTNCKVETCLTKLFYEPKCPNKCHTTVMKLFKEYYQFCSIDIALKGYPEANTKTMK